MAKRMASDGAVLDLGCGRTGGIERFWRQARLAVGADPDLGSLVARGGGMPVVQTGGERLPFLDRCFDLVVSVWVLEHLEAPGTVFREVARVLKAGGHFVFLTPNVRNPLVLGNRLGRVAPWLQHRFVADVYGRGEKDTFAVRYRANTTRRLRALAAESGFEVIELRVIPDPTYLAFNALLYRAAVVGERLLPPSLGVHLLGDFVRAT